MEDNMNIPKEKFEFVDRSDISHDKKLDTKPIGYFKDAWIRFCKNKASVVATVIIVIIILYALIVPFCGLPEFMDTYYAKLGPRNVTLKQIGIADGGSTSEYSESSLIAAYSLGVAAEDTEDKVGTTTWEDGLNSYYQPVIKVTGSSTSGGSFSYTAEADAYLAVGFIYTDITQSVYADIVAWQEETGLQVLYPLIADNEYTLDSTNANYWYKMSTARTSRGVPLNTTEDGDTVTVTLEELEAGTAQLEDNYRYDSDGNLVYYTYSGGGTTETAQYRVRVLYYNYYVYQHGFEPEYLFGTDSQGYDMMLRLARGIQLSLIVALCVSVINLIIGAIYGAIEGYYGGMVDLIGERISDILSGVPFVVVATLFQIHLASTVGAIPSLLFAFVMTGWISTASRTRTQFYRFKNSEYVLAARTLGARDRRIIWKHIFPNSLGTIITSSVLIIPSVIFNESMLSYLGIVSLGSASMTSLGTLLSDASSIWTHYPHLMFFPALVISLLMICFNLFGNGLRDAFNPSLRGVED